MTKKGISFFKKEDGPTAGRSEERRVGEEGRSRGGSDQLKKKKRDGAGDPALKRRPGFPGSSGSRQQRTLRPLDSITPSSAPPCRLTAPYVRARFILLCFSSA